MLSPPGFPILSLHPLLNEEEEDGEAIWGQLGFGEKKYGHVVNSTTNPHVQATNIGGKKEAGRGFHPHIHSKNVQCLIYVRHFPKILSCL